MMFLWRLLMRGTRSTVASDLARFLVRRGISIDEAARNWGLTSAVLRQVLSGDKKIPAHIQQEVKREDSQRDRGDDR